MSELRSLFWIYSSKPTYGEPKFNCMTVFTDEIFRPLICIPFKCRRRFSYWWQMDLYIRFLLIFPNVPLDRGRI